MDEQTFALLFGTLFVIVTFSWIFVMRYSLNFLTEVREFMNDMRDYMQRNQTQTRKSNIMNRSLIGSIIAGIISIIIGVTVTAIVSQFITPDGLTWALIAVGFASFFSVVASYISGQSRNEPTTS